MLTSTAVGAPLSPLALNVTFSGVPGVGPHAVASAIEPRPVPGNVADGDATSGGVVNESALAIVVLLLSVAEYSKNAAPNVNTATGRTLPRVERTLLGHFID